ncbi:MAG: AraC family transcriptional regulator [Clostridia bacterium]|nr:AraC family transcriptional regulator [Clostridia bacterium]
MNNIVLFDAFRFFRITYDKYHYTDNRCGVPEHYLAYMEQGTCRLVSEESSVDVQEGDVFYIPMGLPYQSFWHGEGGVSFITLGFKLFPEAYDHHFQMQTIPCSNGIKERIKNITVNRSPDSRTISDFFGVLDQLIPSMKAEKRSSAERIYASSREYILKNVGCTVKDLARHCAVSESTLYLAFKTVANKTPNAVKNEVLCERAQMLLTTTDQSVQEISDRLGFSSTSYFRKILKAYTGKTPREIRKQAKNV